MHNGTTPDDRLTERLATLLAKAEATDNEHERDAFMDEVVTRTDITLGEMVETLAGLGNLRSYRAVDARRRQLKAATGATVSQAVDATHGYPRKPADIYR